MDRSNHVAIVTGGASGIGAATVREFASEGAAVAIFDINQELGQQVAQTLQAEGFHVEFFAVDVSDQAACQQGVNAVIERWSRIDYLANIAASFIGKGLDATAADWDRSLGVNIRGCANMVQTCYEPLRAGEGKAIVNIASISAHIAQPNRWTYNANKGAIVAMTKCQALDLAPERIRVNVISPGWIWTPEVSKAAEGDRAKWEPVWGEYHMLRRLGEPREVARAVLFLCSPDASFITGTELAVDGGYLGLGSERLGGTSTFAGSR
jgi:NAD(P)-dependent dehydrogenase (short-subunit alcohol dehydrogenase family)